MHISLLSSNNITCCFQASLKETTNNAKHLFGRSYKYHSQLQLAEQH